MPKRDRIFGANTQQTMKEQIKQEIKDTLALYEIARPWNVDRFKLVEDLAEMTTKDILKLVKEYDRNHKTTNKRNKRCSVK